MILKKYEVGFIYQGLIYCSVVWAFNKNRALACVPEDSEVIYVKEI